VAGTAFAQQPCHRGGCLSEPGYDLERIDQRESFGGYPFRDASNQRGKRCGHVLRLSLTNSGTNTLTFTSSGLTSTNSTQITISGTTITGLAWITQPANAVYGSPFGTPGVVATVDQYGNPSTNGLGSTLQLTIALASGGGSLSGTTNYNIGSAGRNGVVTLSNLSVTNCSGNNYQLTASIPVVWFRACPSGWTPVRRAAWWELRR